ncbi:MAG: AraC family transcriptional regulator [Reichenbachiella sp.]
MPQINIVGISILAVLALFIMQKKTKIQSDYVLLITNVLLAIFLFSDLWVKESLSYPSLILNILISFYLLPSLVIYGLLLIAPNHTFQIKWLLIGSYAITATIFVITDFFIFNNYDQKGLKELYEFPPFIYHVLYKGHFLYVILVLFWFLKKFRKYQMKIKEYYSNTEAIHLNWFRNFVWMYIVINLISPIVFLMYNFGIIQDISIPYLLLNTSLVLALFYFCICGIKQYSIANFFDATSKSNANLKMNKEKKYATSSLTNEEMEVLFAELVALFEEEKLYCNAQLKIQEIAERLNVSSNKISQTINLKAQKPFFDFVNEYRVEHFKSLLLDPEKQVYTILGLGLDSGFNSKASLNRIFKQFTGLSPKEFKAAA